MRISELLQLTPQFVTRDFTDHLDFFIPEAVPHTGFLGVDLDPPGESERIEVRVLKYKVLDSRRIWKLSILCLDNNPVLVSQMAGREGREFRRRFIVDAALYRALLKAIFDMPVFEGQQAIEDDLVPVEEDLGDKLTVFYATSIDS